MPRLCDVTEKLVRDRIEEFSLARKDERVFRTATPEELPRLFAEKLVEEALEVGMELEELASQIPDTDRYREVRTRLVLELADLKEVIREIQVRCGISPPETEAMRKIKYKRKGGFERGSVLQLRSHPPQYQNPLPRWSCECGQENEAILTPKGFTLGRCRNRNCPASRPTPSAPAPASRE